MFDIVLDKTVRDIFYYGRKAWGAAVVEYVSLIINRLMAGGTENMS